LNAKAAKNAKFQRRDFVLLLATFACLAFETFLSPRVAMDDTFTGMKAKRWLPLLLVCIAAAPLDHATRDDEIRYYVPKEALVETAHHTRHEEIYGKDIEGYNLAVLRAIDVVQKSSPEGGGYFIGVKAQPPESPIGYPLALFGKHLLAPPRTTSYCSGSTYSAFIEAMNIILPDGAQLSPDRHEALRMQEQDGGRREDGVKFWGHWNDDGFGCQFALVQYAEMGKEIQPISARPGDFMNVSWVSGVGHSVIFLGYHYDDTGHQLVRYWASQKGTNGLGDQSSPVEKIKEVKIVRLTKPSNIFKFKIDKHVNPKVAGDKIAW
jgi:hypothetical protein